MWLNKTRGGHRCRIPWGGRGRGTGRQNGVGTTERLRADHRVDTGQIVGWERQPPVPQLLLRRGSRASLQRSALYSRAMATVLAPANCKSSTLEVSRKERSSKKYRKLVELWARMYRNVAQCSTQGSLAEEGHSTSAAHIWCCLLECWTLRRAGCCTRTFRRRPPAAHGGSRSRLLV